MSQIISIKTAEMYEPNCVIVVGRCFATVVVKSDVVILRQSCVFKSYSLLFVQNNTAFQLAVMCGNQEMADYIQCMYLSFIAYPSSYPLHALLSITGIKFCDKIVKGICTNKRCRYIVLDILNGITVWGQTKDKLLNLFAWSALAYKWRLIISYGGVLGAAGLDYPISSYNICKFLLKR
jgi:hypothetical protein